MAVTLSLFAGVGAQFLDNSGNVLTGGKIYTYGAGTTTPAETYTDVSGTTPHPNPIILDASGRVPGGEIWLTLGVGYKFILKTSTEVLIATYDNIPSSAQPLISNDADSIAYEQGYTVTAGSFVVGQTYRILSVGTTNFTLIGAAANTVGLHFIATGVGTGDGTAELSQTVETKLRQTVSVTDFGVVGDGVTNDTVAIQTAINAISLTGGTLFFPKGTYKCSSELTLSASNVHLLGENGTVLDFSSAPAGNTALRIFGAGRSTSALLSANAVEGDYTVTLASGGGAIFSGDSWVQLVAEDAYDFNGSDFVKRGEIKYLLKQPSTDVLQFDTHIYENYTTANSAKVFNVSFIENVTVSGLSFVGIGTEAGNDFGVRAFWVNNLTVKDCHFIDFEFYALAFQNCIHGSARNNYFDGVRYQSSAGSIFYGLVLLNNTQWFTAHGNIGRELRHLVTTTSTATDYGQPFFGTVSNNVMESAIGGDGFASYAYENHGFGRFINWIGNVADSCWSGFNFEIGDQVVVGNVIRGCRSNGFLFGDTNAGRNLENIIISNNYVDLATSDSTSPFYGFFFPNNVNSVRRNIIISNNTVTNTNATNRSAAYGIRILGGLGAADNCTITGNTFNNVAEASPSDFCLRIEQANWTATNNSIRNFQRAVYVAPTADNIVINGNIFVNVAYTSTLSFVQIFSNNCAIANNTFKNSYRTITINTGVTGTKISNNTEYSIAQPISDSGTGTQIGSYATNVLPGPVTFTGSPATITIGDNYIFNRGAAQIVNMPDPTLFAGRTLNFKNIQAQTVDSAASNIIPIDSATAGTAILPAVDGAWATLLCDGTNWIIMTRGT